MDPRARSATSKIWNTTVSTAAMDPEWDRFVADCEDPHPQQTTGWAQLQELRGWKAVRVVLRHGANIAGGAQVLERQAGRFGKIGYLNRGPLTATDCASLREELVETIQMIGRQRRMIYLAAVLPFTASPWTRILKSRGFDISPDVMPPRTEMRSSIVLDLTQSLDELLARMPPKKRNKIRQGSKKGLIFREGTEADLDTFNALLAALCERRQVSSNIPIGEFVHRAWKSFAPKGQLKLFLTEHESEPVSAMLLFSIGGWARVWRTGWSGKYTEQRPNDLLHWEAINWAKNHGDTRFDFMGFDTGNAQALLQGETIAAADWCPISQFKHGFGGEVLPPCSPYCYFFNPAARVLFKAAGRPFLNSRLGQRLLQRLEPHAMKT